MTVKVIGDGVSVELVPRVPANPIVVKVIEDTCTRLDLQEPEVLAHLNRNNYPHAPQLVSVLYTVNESIVCRHVILR